MSDTQQPFFLAHNDGFAEYDESADLLHPETHAAQPGDSLTETQYLGFSVPEENIHALGYMWHHGNLGVVTGGLWAWQGFRPNQLDCELFDMRAFMSDSLLENDLHEYRLSNGYGVKLVEPLKKLHMTYEDAAHGNAADVEYTAVTPPVMFGSGMHFEQGLKAKGHVVLRGKRYEIDGYNIRDRSWGQLRPEDPLHLPPPTWMTGAFGDDFIFNCNAFDHPRMNPVWEGAFEIPEEQVLKGGWIFRDGEVIGIASVEKRTEHDARTLFPTVTDMKITDARGKVYEMRGKVTAASTWLTWPTVSMCICLTRWECEGRVGYGDTQQAHWPDFIHHMRKRG